MISRTVEAVPKARSDAQARSNASPIAEIAASSKQPFESGIAAMITSHEMGREHCTVSQSPKPEAVR